MPTYEYTCAHCGHSLEAHQSMNEAPLCTCPACHRSTLQRRSAQGTVKLFRQCGFFQRRPAQPPAAEASGTGSGADSG